MLSNLPISRYKISIAKVLYKLVVPFYGKKSRVIIRNGITYEVDLSEGIDLSLFLFGNFQKHVTKNKFLKLPSDATILDVGGNFGMMALQFASEAPKGEVISFEPTHYAISKFQKNLELNPNLKQHITVVNSFVSNETTTNSDFKAFSSWKVSDEKRSNDQHPVHLGTPKSTKGVGSITLDDFLLRMKLVRIDLIKIDTDGHEYMVLNGAKDCIAKYRPKVIFEVGQYLLKEKNIDFSFFLDYFDKFNYKLVDSKSGKEITTKNQNSIIPKLGTIDIIALPN